MKQLTAHDIIRRRLYEEAGLDYDYGWAKFTLEELWASNWSTEFVRLMRAKFGMGGFRYGLMVEQVRDMILLDHLASIYKRLRYYRKTGDMDVLPDISNIAMAEWMHPYHENAHRGHDDHGYHSPGRMR